MAEEITQNTRGIEASGAEGASFIARLGDALTVGADHLTHERIPQLLEALRSFHAGLTTVYTLFTAKGYITEDPYKNDIKMGELKLPENGPITENNRRDQVGQRLSHLDNQFDFICHFFSLSLENLDQETIKKLVSLVRFVEWNRLSPDSKSVTTVAVAEFVTIARKSITDSASAVKLTEAFLALEKGTDAILRLLKEVSDFNRESYKYDVRTKVLANMPPEQLQFAAIKSAFDRAMRGVPFYKELVDEIIQEDTAPNSEALREDLLNRLAVKNEKPKAAKKHVDSKPNLIIGLNVLGSAGATLTEIINKLVENDVLMHNRKKGLFKKLVDVFAQFTNKETDATYEFEIFDPAKGTAIKTNLNFNAFKDEIDKKARILSAMTARGSAAAKLDSMDEKQLVSLLRKNIRDIGHLYKTLSGLDEFFKTAVDKESRPKVKGIKPELAALKSAQSQGGQKMIDYETAKEAEKQFKELGVQVKPVDETSHNAGQAGSDAGHGQKTQ
jgi:hypothetical protein